MYQVFNMGIGMVVIVAPRDAQKIAKQLKATAHRSHRSGTWRYAPVILSEAKNFANSEATLASNCEVPRFARDDKQGRGFNFALMETRQFGRTDMRVSVLGFGAAEIGFEETESKHSERARAGSV